MQGNHKFTSLTMVFDQKYLLKIHPYFLHFFTLFADVYTNGHITYKLLKMYE